MDAGLRACHGPDALSTGEEKYCQAPMHNFGPLGSATSYCVQSCEDISNCTLSCPLGLAIDGGCRVCRCAPNPYDTMTCAADETCRLVPPPCAYFPGRPLCPMALVCMNNNGGSI
ncbi:unnamed protein product [Rotaria sordida]|uniref:Uncharacterized protein n=1 Tax=Rotaria sordida TaxID=392033 RepID=A0A819FGX3_9BILA|nr:unnamed protein product [Rotaria sordida]CAF1192115.1 unnamed protein product [Rotaria sordida]CAF3809549.1 unnamed protein product [Rotaria sordida]CAF3868481.1 unnamed protein product [Rotaria sordida]